MKTQEYLEWRTALHCNTFTRGAVFGAMESEMKHGSAE